MRRPLAYILCALAPLVLLLLTAAGCASHDMEDIAVSPATAPQDSNAYIRLRIAIPHAAGETGASTRATEEHGILTDYEVHNGYIVLFSTDQDTFEEDQLTYQSKYDLLDNTDKHITNDKYDLKTLFQSDESEHITSSGYITMKLNDSDKAKKHIFAMVLLNLGKDFVAKSEETFAKFKDETFAKFKKRPDFGIGSVENGYFMSNVAMSTKSGTNVSGAKIVTIPEVTKIFMANGAQDVATIDDGTTVFVERAAAKVTVQKETDKTDIIIDGNEKNTAIIHNMDWIVDNYNEKTYLARNFNSEWLSSTNSSGHCPFVDDTEVKDNYGITVKEDRYRTLWGEDVNYDNATNLKKDESGSFADLYKSGESAIIAENTLKKNEREYATRVVIRIQLKDASKVLLKSPYYGVNYGGKDYIFTTKEKFEKWKTEKGYSGDATEYSASSSGLPYVYYEAFIKHFGDAAPTDEDNNALGKYGVVRNNAYTITISALSALGSPIYPALGTGSID